MFCSEILLDKHFPIDSFENRGSLLRTFLLKSRDEDYDDIWFYPCYLFVYERGVVMSPNPKPFDSSIECYISYDEFMSYEYGYSTRMVEHHIIEFCRQYIGHYNHWLGVESEKFAKSVKCYCLDNDQECSITELVSAIVDSYPSRAYYKEEIERSNERGEVKRNRMTFKYDPKQLDTRRK